jgi:hypothetical protein
MDSVMRRKLVKQGPSTLTVSLPSTWVKANNLHTGQEVVLVTQQNKVIVSVDLAEEEGSIVNIDVRPLSPRMVGWILSAMHKKGYDEIRLTANPDQYSAIEARVNKSLLGYEIVQHQGTTLVIRFITKIDAEEFPVLLRRAFLVTISLAESVVKTPHEAKDALMLEETNNRITNYCERILNKSAHQQPDIVFKYLIVWLLEKIADQYRDAIQAGKINVEDAKTCLDLLKLFYELYYKYSLEKHDQFATQLNKGLEELTQRKSTFTPVLQTLHQTSGSIIAINI